MLENLILPNRYYDSVLLMSVASKIKTIDGIDDISLIMGTDANKNVLKETNFLTEVGATAKPDDLIIAINFNEKKIKKENIISIVEEYLKKEQSMQKKDSSEEYKTIESALKNNDDLNLVFFSIPGTYVKSEAEIALKHGKNIMIFSDNVSIEEEKYLKNLAYEKGLIVMGPDCGTAIINGIGLGFANKIKKGDIGIVGAAGTGIQEVTSILDKFDLGISQAIGTGGRDLSAEIGGLSMMTAINALLEDNQTKIIILISKPPAPEVEEKILNFIKDKPKKFVITFLNSQKDYSDYSNLYFAKTLEEGALKCVAIYNDSNYNIKPFIISDEEINNRIKKIRSNFSDEQKYLRGLYSGGTLCDEAYFILEKLDFFIYSNRAKKDEHKLKNIYKSERNTLLDMGEDEFTRGTPHPMIDFTKRCERMIQEANDKETAIILFDLVLGFGAHPKPLEPLLETINKIKKICAKEKRYIAFICALCGTKGDIQNYDLCFKELQKADVNVFTTNAQTARFAALLLNPNLSINDLKI